MVAVEVFDRGQDFDQTVDPIVKIQTDILRRALVRHYETTGNSARQGIMNAKATF